MGTPSNPGWATGYAPIAAEWEAAFSSKADYPVPFGQGGTGLTTTPGAGTILIGTGSGFTLATLTAGSNITITNTSGGITIASTGGGGTYPVTSSHEMANASFDMAGDFGNVVSVTCTTPLSATATLGISRWANLNQTDNLALRSTGDQITVSRSDTGPFWLLVATVDWSTIDGAFSYVPLWGFHPGMSCTTTNGSAQIVTTDTTSMFIGAPVVGAFVPAGAVVQSVDNKTQFTISNPDMTPAVATGSGATTLTFGGSTKEFTWTGSGWNSNPGHLEVLIAGNVNYSQTGQMRSAPFGTYWSQFNKALLQPGDSTYNSIIAYPATFPDKTIINWDWPNYALGTGVWGYGNVTYGDYDSPPIPPLGFASTGPKPVQHCNTAYFEAPYAYHIRWMSEGANWDLLSEYYLWETSAPTSENTKVIEIAWNPYTVYFGTPLYQQFSPQYLGEWTDKFGVSWFVVGKTGAEVVFSPADPTNETYISGGNLDYRGGAAYLISQGQISGLEWNHGVAFGVEPILGSGSIQIDHWSPKIGGGKFPTTPATPVAPTIISLNNLNLDVGYTIPQNGTGCVYTVNGGTNYAGWDASVSLNRTRRLRPGTTYNVSVAGYNADLRGPASPTLSMTTTFASVDFTSTSIWESTLINDSVNQNFITVTPASYELPGGSTNTGALLQDVSESTAEDCNVSWNTLPSLLPGTYAFSVYYNNIGDNRNFSLTYNISSSRFFGFNVEANALSYFGIPGVTDGFFGGNFSDSAEIFEAITFNGCQDNWWRVIGQWQITQPVPAGMTAIIRFLNRDAVTGNQYQTPYIPTGTGSLGFNRFAVEAVDFSTSDTTYYGTNSLSASSWALVNVTQTTVPAWGGVGTATQYNETTGSGIQTGVSQSITVDTAAHEYIICFDVQSIGRDFFFLSFDSADFARSLNILWQLSTQQVTNNASGLGDMTLIQSGVTLLAPNEYRLWARVQKPATVTAIFAQFTCSSTGSSPSHTGNPANGFILQNNSRVCQVL